MTFREFVEKIYPLVGQYWLENSSSTSPYGGTCWQSVTSIKDVTPSTSLVGDEVCTGGTSGGSCWNEGETTYHGYHNEVTPELASLDMVLEEIAPNITYLQFKKLLREADVKEFTHSTGDYYGNKSDYAKKYVNLGDLYDALVSLGLIQ